MKLKILALISAIGVLVSVLAIPAKADGSIAIGVIGNQATFIHQDQRLRIQLGYQK